MFFLSLVSVLFAIMTVTANNPVFSILHLIGLFATIGLYLIMAGLTFVGISYLLVYVGAISILFLFILMLINVRISELLTEGLNSAGLGIIAIVALSFNLSNVLPHYLQISDPFSNYLTGIGRAIQNPFYAVAERGSSNSAVFNPESLEAASVNSNTWDAFLAGINHIASIGNILYSDLFILLLIISLVLLLAMVGTIVITLKRESNLKQVNLLSGWFDIISTALDCLNCFDIFGGADSAAAAAERAIPTPNSINAEIKTEVFLGSENHADTSNTDTSSTDTSNTESVTPTDSQSGE